MQQHKFRAGEPACPVFFLPHPHMKTCNVCKSAKDPSEFYRDSRMTDGRKSLCKSCYLTKSHGWNKKNKARCHSNQILLKYGITAEQYESLLNAQGRVCAICKKPCALGKRLAVDHDHATNKNRGLLCFNCNTGLGKFLDCPAILQRAMEYLCSYMTVPKA